MEHMEITVDQLQRDQGSIPEDGKYYDYTLDLGSGALESGFELAVSPTRTRCCAHLFCAEHIAAWLTGPAADGLCPTCRAPLSLDSGRLLALGHPALTRAKEEQVLRAPPNSSDEEDEGCATPTARSYAAYPSVPAPSHSLPRGPVSPSLSSPSSPLSPCSSDGSSRSATSSSSEEEDAWEDYTSNDDNEAEDSTDYSLPALVRARALQTRRHVPHPLASLLGFEGAGRAALGRVVRVAGWVLVVGVLAARAGAGGGWA
ncbi:hypothetical protein C8R47DRAFT_219630 [Mycena vitilis]|nr:hypothetical protein C8R47DRAFT_219630 [Mycena vitilis]